MYTGAPRIHTALASAAAAIAIPAMVLAGAGAAHATARGLDVTFAPQLGAMVVTISDTVGAGKQNCSYNARPESASVLPPVHKDFVLGLDGTTTLKFPGVATGTLWRVHIDCTYDPPNPFAKPGFFDDTHEY